MNPMAESFLPIGCNAIQISSDICGGDKSIITVSNVNLITAELWRVKETKVVVTP